MTYTPEIIDSERPHSRQHVTSATGSKRRLLAGLSIALLGSASLVGHSPQDAGASSRAEITVTGGQITDSGGFRYHAFTHEGLPGDDTTSDLVVDGASITGADVLVVAGGGGGGRNRGGGGGAGGLLFEANQTLSESTHSVVIGGGGKGGSDPDGWKDNEASPGCQGEDSSFLTLTATGGGGGGATASSASWVDCEGDPLAADYGADATDGGSGGGGGYGGDGGTGVSGQGSDGAAGASSSGGGGGGASDLGNSINGGMGTTGVTITAMGEATTLGESDSGMTYFAGGGGGFSGGSGGTGGGGDSGVAGTAHTGGGGGACQSTSCTGGSPGGSGVVIIRYAVPSFSNSATLPAVDQGSVLQALSTTGEDVELVAGALPGGISVSGTDFIGTTTASGTFTFTLRSFDQSDTSIPALYTDKEFSVTVTAPESSSSSSTRSKDDDDETAPAPVAAPTSPTPAPPSPNSALRPSPFLYGDSVFLPGAGALGPVREPYRERDGAFTPPEAPTISANESFGTARAEVVTNLTDDGPIIGDLVSFLSLGKDDLTVGLQTALGTQTGASGAPELWSPRGGELEFAGEGLRPGSSVQIFLGFAEDGSAEVAQVTVNEAGSFAGSAALESLDPPLPIGRHLLQIVAVDPGGNRVIIDVAAVIVPPAEPRFEVDADTGEAPALEPGGVLATREGEPATASVIRETENAVTAIIGEEDDPQGSATFQGSSVEETESVPQMVVFPNDHLLGVSVTDWRPNTPGHVWIFSEPTLLGTFTTNDEGAFEGEFTIDGDTIAVGQHTLQVQGIDRDGYTQSINLGILVGEATNAPAPTQDSMSIGWLWWMLAGVGLFALIVLGFWLLSRRRSA